MHALTYVTCTYATTTTATTTTTTTTTTHSHNYDCDHDHNHYYDSDHDQYHIHDSTKKTSTKTSTTTTTTTTKRAGKTQKRTGMTSLGSPKVSSQSVSGFLAEKGRENRETDWDDTPGEPRRVIPVRFEVFWPKRAGKTWKRTGMTSLGTPGVSSQSVSFFGPKKGRENPQMD